MTTIAWDGITLAADRGSVSGYVINAVDKIFVLGVDCHATVPIIPCGSAVAFCGNAVHCMALLEWMETGDKATPIPECIPEDKLKTACGVIVTPQRVVYRISCGSRHLEKIESVPHADGGGQEFAIAAMLAGAGAMKAVIITAKRSWLSSNGYTAAKINPITGMFEIIDKSTS